MERTDREYTPEEIAEAHDRNETFHGTRPNFAKIQLYHALKADLWDFVRTAGPTVSAGGYDPNTREKHAILWLDLPIVARFTNQETAKLADMMQRADGAIVASTETGTRLTLEIRDIWEDEL